MYRSYDIHATNKNVNLPFCICICHHIILQNDASRVLVDEKKCTIGISSEHSNNPDCGPCKKEGKPTKAKIFCENCNAFVCESCKNCHSKFDILRLHSFISINESTRVSLFKEKPENLSKCDCCKGDNNTVEKYCEKHEEFICTECTNLKHKDCEDCNIVSKEWILNGFDVNVHLDELLLKVEYLKEEIQNIKYDCHFSIIPKKDRIKEEADKFKTEIEERTQNLVRKFSNELEDFTADNNTYYSMLENMLKITDAGVDLLKNNKYNKQRAFILTSKLSKNVKDYETILRDLKAGTFPHLVFQRNETLVCMLGDINNIGAVQLIPHS